MAYKYAGAIRVVVATVEIVLRSKGLPFVRAIEAKSDEFWHQAKSELETDEPGEEPVLDDPKPMPE